LDYLTANFDSKTSKYCPLTSIPIMAGFTCIRDNSNWRTDKLHRDNLYAFIPDLFVATTTPNNIIVAGVSLSD
jgi:hypothetical protein